VMARKGRPHPVMDRIELVRRWERPYIGAHGERERSSA
jgi:hypothetical protein